MFRILCSVILHKPSNSIQFRIHFRWDKIKNHSQPVLCIKQGSLTPSSSSSCCTTVPASSGLSTTSGQPFVETFSVSSAIVESQNNTSANRWILNSSNRDDDDLISEPPQPAIKTTRLIRIIDFRTDSIFCTEFQFAWHDRSHRFLGISIGLDMFAYVSRTTPMVIREENASSWLWRTNSRSSDTKHVLRGRMNQTKWTL